MSGTAAALKVDVIIVGAGAAGMMCALTAAQRGRSVLLLDHSGKLAEKIRISGGGRCNFTNLDVKPENYLSRNPHFCRSALARFTPRHFIALMDKHKIAFHEKAPGQMFSNEGSEAVIAMLKSECDAAGVRWCMPCEVQEILPLCTQEGRGIEDNLSSAAFRADLTDGPDEEGEVARYRVCTTSGQFQSQSIVIATGGLSIPKMGATPFGYKIAQQFGLPVTKLKPGLVPLSFHPVEWEAYAELAGVSMNAIVSVGKQSFRENILFTHRGLSGPAILQISSYWEHGQALSINLLPDQSREEFLGRLRGSRMLPGNFLAQYLPRRFADVWCGHFCGNRPLKQYSEKALTEFADKLHDWEIIPTGTLGYGKAEVTCGGVDTHALSSKTMQANSVPGLYFIGEVVDVTGQLGGFNFQWAWASGHAAGQAA